MEYGSFLLKQRRQHANPVMQTALILVLFLGGSSLNGATQLSQFGITWTFDKDYAVGQFANDDWWIVGPVTIMRIDPPSVSGDHVRNGSMLNPSPTLSKTGYDSRISFLPYNAALNVAEDISPTRPLVIPPHHSLISTISVQGSYERPQVKSAAVLTILPAPASAGSFRPPYCGADKSIKYNISAFSVSGQGFDLLLQLPPVGSTPALTDVEALFERPWIDHQGGWLADRQHPQDNMPHYGREMSTEIGIGALMLHLDFPNTQKETLLTRYVQLGIDLFGIVQNGGNWNWIGEGGVGSGRKYPILFAGLALNDAKMKDIGKKSGDYLYDGPYGAANVPPDYIHFGEDDQTFSVSQSDIYTQPYEAVTVHGFTFYGHGNPSKLIDLLEYMQAHLGMPEWGVDHSTYPLSDGVDWDYVGSYRLCCTATAWAGFVLSTHFMDIKGLWNHNALFDYMDLYMDREQGNVWRQTSSFVKNMWDTYRANYSAVDETPPVEPNGLNSPVQGLGFIKLSWNVPGPAPDNDYAFGYHIYRDGNFVGSTSFNNQYADTGLSANSTYSYEVFSVDNAGNLSLTGAGGIFSTLVDVDGDHLPDVWELQYFGDLNQTAEGDPDIDDLNNLLEFQLGTDPTVFDDLPGDLVLDMKFDDDPIDGVFDSSEYAQPGMALDNARPQLVPGRINSAYQFDGQDDYVFIADSTLTGVFPSSSSQPASGFTIAAWITLATLDDRQPIVAKQSSPDRGFVFMKEADHKLTLESFPSAGSASILQSATTLTTDRWTHVAVTYDQINGEVATLYIDGNPDGQQSNFGGRPLANSKDLNIGRYFWSEDFLWHFEGSIDALRVYNRALSAVEIQALYAEAP